MISDRSIQEQGYFYFLQEAPELLQVIEQELMTLLDDRSTAKVHSLMRATHTLKGSAANVGLEVINTIAHSLEDVVKTLYNPDVAVDTELQSLLLQAYECLREPLMAEFQESDLDKDEVLQRSSAIFARLQDKLGDFFGAQSQIPSSVELGFDVVQSVFEMGVKQRLESIARALQGEEEAIASCLRSEAEVFVGLAESLNLPGFGEIAQKTLAALELHPEQAREIGKIALADFQHGREQIIAGDRTVGGTPSPQLQQLAGEQASQPALEHLDPDLQKSVSSLEAGELSINPSLPTYSLELEQFNEFLTRDRHKLELTPQASQFCLKAIPYFLEWFHHSENIPLENLSLTLLVPHVTQVPSDNLETALQEARIATQYIQDWIERCISAVKEEQDSISLVLYRQGAILTVVLAVAKFLYRHQTSTPEPYRDIPLIQLLRRKRNRVVKNYKNYPPVSNEEKKWLRRLQPAQALINLIEPSKSEFLIDEIWGQSPETLSAPSAEPTKIVEEVWGESSSIQIATPETLVSLTQEVETPNTQTENLIFKTEPERHPIQPEKLKREKASQPLQNQSVRVNLEELERLNYLVGNLLINQNRQVLQDEQLQSAVQELRLKLKRHQQTLNQLRDWSNLMLSEPDYQRVAIRGNTSLGAGNTPIRQTDLEGRSQSAIFDSLEFDHYTDLYNLFNTALEETLQLNAVTDIIDQVSKQLGYTLEKNQTLLSHVRNDMTSVQMLPLGDVLGRFPRMIQQLAAANNKPVELKISGGDVLVDKAIAEKLYDPLLHLVRNAFDHGIESVEVRQQRGKLHEGQIEIRAYHQGDRTIIEVKDDGKGLDFERIRRRAIELNFVSAEQAHQLSKSQLLDLLFEPGFSTKETVSDLSGRGIGLDVVRNQLENLKGSITVESQPQMGTTFSLQIPFSLTSAKFFVCQSQGVTYALLSDSIDKIVLPQAEQIQVIEGKKGLLYPSSAMGGEKDVRVIPVYQLSELISYNESFVFRSNLRNQEANLDKKVKEQTNQLFLLRGNTGLFALEVDQIIGEQELVIRPLGSAIAAPNYIFGCSILGDGRLILAIDGAVLVDQTASFNQPQLSEGTNLSVLPSSTTRLAITGAVRELPPAKTVEANTVLVVDDSLSYRQTLALNLQKAGYQVYQAQDGLEALEKLRQFSNIGLVICDLEMPRMNGFEFLKHYQQEPNSKKMPIIMLTSRSSEKHRLLALELGAAAYFTKPYLEQDLLGKIAQLQETQN